MFIAIEIPVPFSNIAMKIIVIIALLPFVFCGTDNSIVYSSVETNSRSKQEFSLVNFSDAYVLIFHVSFRSPNSPDLIHLTVVACGSDRVEETMVMFKSAILFTEKHIHLHVFADDENRPTFVKEVRSWMLFVCLLSFFILMVTARKVPKQMACKV